MENDQVHIREIKPFNNEIMRILGWSFRGGKNDKLVVFEIGIDKDVTITICDQMKIL